MTRELRIIPVLNGWIVDVGCQRVVFTDREVMAREMMEYYRNPDETEKRYMANAVNRIMPEPAAAPPEPQAMRNPNAGGNIVNELRR